MGTKEAISSTVHFGAHPAINMSIGIVKIKKNSFLFMFPPA
jgi:hypothetical protein